MRWGLFVVLTWWLSSCSGEHNYAQIVRLPDSCWTEKQNAIFEFSTLPGAETSEIVVFIHTDIQFTAPFARLTVKTIDPNGLFWEDNLDIARVDNALSLRTSSAVLRRKVRWTKQGNYTISIRPNSTLHGVRAVGINISNVINKPKKINK